MVRERYYVDLVVAPIRARDSLVEPRQWSAGPLTVGLRGVDSGLDPPELLLVLDTSEVTHNAGEVTPTLFTDSL